jgi:glycosyltransferase involved in cell wall biosynthesis
MRVYTRMVQSQVARTAEAVITVSQYSKRCIVKRFQVLPERVVVTYLAPATLPVNDQANAERAERGEDGLETFILALASASPRKNIDRLLEAYHLLNRKLRKRFPLLVVCSHNALRGQLERQVEDLGIVPGVRFLERVSDEALTGLMTAASLFVFPSLEEGFGLPPLKAMACGTPVVASDTSSLPEVLGDAAVLVSPTDTQAMADAIAAVLTTPSLATDLSEKGLTRSRQFSWEATARQTLQVYQSVLKGVA